MSVSKPIIVDNIDAVLRSGAVSTVDVSCSLRKHFQLFFLGGVFLCGVQWKASTSSTTL